MIAIAKAYRTHRNRLGCFNDVRPQWRGDHVELRELWNDYSQYLYLPRLRDSGVLARAIEEGVSATTWDPDTFAYAGRVDGDGRYVAWWQARSRTSYGQHCCSCEAGSGSAPDNTPGPNTTAASTAPPKGRLPVKFFGRVSLEPVRLIRDVGDIAEAIVRQLEKAGKTEIRITLEVDADSESGFAEDVQRTVTENARTLRFDTHEFEEP